MELKTRITKGRDGFRAETIIPLDRPGEEGWQLSITTGKASRGGLYSTAGTHRVDGGFLTTRIFRDFRATVLTEPGKRCTEKAVGELHQRALERLNDILKAEAAWEAEQVAKEAASTPLAA